MTSTNAAGEAPPPSTFSVAKALAWFVGIVVAGGLLLVSAPAIQAFGMGLWSALFG